jgi:hypothetical protein
MSIQTWAAFPHGAKWAHPPLWKFPHVPFVLPCSFPTMSPGSSWYWGFYNTLGQDMVSSSYRVHYVFFDLSLALINHECYHSSGILWINDGLYFHELIRCDLFTWWVSGWYLHYFQILTGHVKIQLNLEMLASENTAPLFLIATNRASNTKSSTLASSFRYWTLQKNNYPNSGCRQCLKKDSWIGDELTWVTGTQMSQNSINIHVKNTKEYKWLYVLITLYS